jgi:hypothetical protein
VEGMEVRRKDVERNLDWTLRDGWRPCEGLDGVSGSRTASASSAASIVSCEGGSDAAVDDSATVVSSSCSAGGGCALSVVGSSSSFFFSVGFSVGFLPFSRCFLSCST